MAVGQLGLKPKYVQHDLTLDEFNLIYLGWFENYKLDMERTRLICYNIFNSSMNRTKEVSIEDFMGFEWDSKALRNKTLSKNSSKEEFEEMKQMMNDFKNNNI